MRVVTGFLIALLFISCAGGTPENLEQHVDDLIAEDEYEEALNAIENADPDETDADLDSLKEKTHLNYGLYLEYRSDPEDMRESMTGALNQYVEVLKINPDNEEAISEIEQIMGIYETMPNREPDQDVMEELQELGFNY